MLFLLTDSPQKLKLEKIHGALIILLYVSLNSPWRQTVLFLLKAQNTISHDFNLCEEETSTSLGKIIKSINSQTCKYDGLKAVVYKHF